MDIVPGDAARLDEVVDLCWREIGTGQPRWVWELITRAGTSPAHEDSSLHLLDGEQLAGAALYHQLSGLLAPVRWLCGKQFAGENWPRRGSPELFPHTLDLPSPDDYYLLEFAIAPQYRRQGHGIRLLHELSERLLSQGVRQLFLHSTEMGHPLYLKAGFEDIAHFHYKNGHGAKLMGKRL
ncbi:GNAT family N-acetyltransferase [Candidatus Woesearchaeota archaeon]|nr:GNAT family N-acetyltransferase [Candidatus Woesearchaeota archaeon]